MIWIKMATILVAAISMMLAAFRHREWRGGLLLLGCVFLSAAMNEPEELFRRFFPIDEPELPAIIFFLVLGVVLAVLNRGTTLVALKAVYANRRFPLLAWGLCLVSVLPQLGTDKHVWAALLPPVYSTHETRELVEHGIEFLGYLFLLNWAILFLKDKWRVLMRRVPSPHEYLLKECSWEQIGFPGSRRICYKLGDSGFCVKFYKPPEECVSVKMKKSIRRDISRRRHDKYRNSCSQEVHIWNRLRHSMPSEIRELLPQVMERVYHPLMGWGVLETLYLNPDGSGIIPLEWTVQHRHDRELALWAYRKIRHYLKLLIDQSAPFYEASNFFAWIQRDGSILVRIIDFEPDSKTLVPLEKIWPWYRRRKVRRNAIRYLRHWRERFGIQEVEVNDGIR